MMKSLSQHHILAVKNNKTTTKSKKQEKTRNFQQSAVEWN